MNAVLAVCLGGQYSCWCSHWAEQKHVSPAQCGKTWPCSTGSLVEIAVFLWTKPDFCCLQKTSGNFIFTHRRLVALLFVFYWVYRSSFQPGVLSFSSRLCDLSYLTLNHRHTHTQTDRQTHTNLKNRLKVDTYTVNIMWKRKVMGCSSSRLVKELCRKGIMTLNLMRGQTNHTGIFFISHVTAISFAPTVKGLRLIKLQRFLPTPPVLYWPLLTFFSLGIWLTYARVSPTLMPPLHS